MTKLRITLPELLAFRPCEPESRKPLFKRRKYMTAAQAVDAGVSIPDILWVVGKLGRKDACTKFALACAVHIEHLDNTVTVKPCNDAMAVYMADPTPANLATLKAKCHAAYAAANAAHYAASYAAAYAAYAAASAANAAHYAAHYADDADAAHYAAAYAADAAHYAAAHYAAAARKKEEAWQRKKLVEILS